MNKKYWLRGGLSLVLAPFVILMILEPIFTTLPGSLIDHVILGILDAYILTFPFIIPLFILGVVAGLLYGRIKNKQRGTTMN